MEKLHNFTFEKNNYCRVCYFRIESCLKLLLKYNMNKKL